MKQLEGYKTYLGIAMMAIGAFGLSDYVTPEQVEVSVRFTFELVGLLFSIYGRKVAKPEE
jgi:hypothetical protein